MNKVLIVLTLLGLTLMSGCTLPNHYEVTFEDGTKINCTGQSQYFCGLNLYGCNNGTTYKCVTNAKIKSVMTE